MHIESLRIQNFRSFVDETILFDDFNSIVGENGAGKSNVLMALNILFRNSKVDNFNLLNLKEDDFHNKNIEQPIKISATFVGLSDDAKADLKDYVRQDKLVVSAKAVWIAGSLSASVNQFGERLGFSEFREYFEADKSGASAAELKEIYKKFQSQFTDLQDASSKGAMVDALHSYEADHPDECDLLESGDSFYGFTKGKNLLSKYIQWIYVPAVKDAASEQDEQKNTALGELLSRTIREKIDFSPGLELLKADMLKEYEKIISANASALADISVSLETRLREWVHEAISLKLDWHFDPEKTLTLNEPWARIFVGERNFISEVGRLGHGMQRSVLISLLQELGSLTNESKAPTLLLGIEEPELYQHPPQARHFSEVLQGISKLNSQVIITTHSPYFVAANGFSSVRRARGCELGKGTKIEAFNSQKLAEDLANALGEPPRPVPAEIAAVQQIMQPSQNELFFARIPILVEGTEDVAFIASHLELNDKWKEFRSLGCHFIISGGKKNQSRLVAICNGLAIPAYSIFDCDGGNENSLDVNKKDNGCLARLSGWNDEFNFPEKPLFEEKFCAWPNTIADSVLQDFGADVWDQVETATRKIHGLESGVRRKNQTLIAATMAEMKSRKHVSSVLTELTEAIFSFARNAQ